MNRSMPGLPVHHQLLELTQTHLHWVGDAIQPSHPPSSPSPPAFSHSQHQGLFQWFSSLHQVVKVLELQHQSCQWIFRTDFLYSWLVWSPCSPRDSQASSPALTVLQRAKKRWSVPGGYRVKSSIPQAQWCSSGQKVSGERWWQRSSESWESAAKLCPQKVSSWKAWVATHCSCSLL